MLDIVKCVCFVVTMLVASVGVALGIEWVDCSSYQRATGRDTKMDFGCYVKDADVWYSRKEFEFKQAGVKDD